MFDIVTRGGKVHSGTQQFRRGQMSYITEEMFEELVKNIVQKFGFSDQRAREKIREALTSQKIHIGTPLIERIRQAQVRAAEQTIVDDLREKGLL